MFDETEFYHDGISKAYRESLWAHGIWIDADEKEVPVAEMNEQRVKYILAFLERKAKAEYYSLVNFYTSCPEPNGEMAQDAFDQELEAITESDWTDILEDYAIVPFIRERLEHFEKERQNRQKEFTMKQNLTNKSTPELLQLKASWLREHEPMLRELALAVWALGNHKEEHNREIAIEQNCNFFFVTSKAAEVVDPKSDKPIVKYWLTVMQGDDRWYQGIQIAYYTFYENSEAYGNADKQFNNFIVPGDWMMIASSIIESARLAEETKFAEEEEKERKYLLNKLLDGKDI